MERTLKNLFRHFAGNSIPVGHTMKPVNPPHFLIRARTNEMTRKEKIIAGQARSLGNREHIKITLPKAPWEKERTR